MDKCVQARLQQRARLYGGAPSWNVAIRKAFIAATVLVAAFAIIDRSATSSYLLRHFTPVSNQIEFDPNFRAIVQDACREHNVTPELVFAMIRAESNFDAQARSRKGAMGLMQLMPQTAEAMAVTDPFDPHDNVRGGVKYLGQLLTQFRGNHTKAVAAYNAGPTAVKRYGGIPPYKETRKYVSKVMKEYHASRGRSGVRVS